MSQAEIARLLGVSRQAVSAAIKRRAQKQTTR
ncbi:MULTISPECIES: winged helix-turn-helix transcriptional regulator [Pseudomonas]|nr:MULTISPECIES: winged helix-turn-helix transcriptional regulator [Pseudomonas]